MSKRAGQLLIARKAAVIAGSDTTVIDTGLCQVNLNVDPPLDGDETTPSRVMVVPLAPYSRWAEIVHTEPFLSSGTVNVAFTKATAGPVTLNVMFLAPAEWLGPVACNHVYEIDAPDCFSSTVVTLDNLSVVQPSFGD